MAVKTKRIELRAEQATLDRIQRAANLVHEQTSEFIRKAAMQRAEDILRDKLAKLRELADALLEQETIDRDAFESLMNGTNTPSLEAATA